jgi:hypothetical protein
MSLPISSSEKPAAMATALPPELPPGVRAGFHGLRVSPNSGLQQWGAPASSGRLLLPIRIAPACRQRATTEASATGR